MEVPLGVRRSPYCDMVVGDAATRRASPPLHPLEKKLPPLHRLGDAFVSPSSSSSTEHELDAEVAEKIHALIDAKRDGVRTNRRPEPTTTLRSCEDRLFPPVPMTTTSGNDTDEPDLWDQLTDSVGAVVTRRDRVPPRIDLQMLVQNHVTVRELIEAGVALSDLRKPGIVRSLVDLKALKFDARDLIRNRLLFSCGVLAQCFSGAPKVTVTQQMLYENGIAFGVLHLLGGPDGEQFYVAELLTLAFSLERMERDGGGLFPNYLHDLAHLYTFDELLSLGLSGDLLRRLGIDAIQACAPTHHNGFGWPREQVDALFAST